MQSCLYAFGSNGTGQLGVGHQDDTSVPQRCMFDSAGATAFNLPGNHEDIADIRAGGNHTLLLTTNGRVYGSGNHRALPVITHDLSTFHLLDVARPSSSAKGITHIAACWETSYFVVDGQVVYACGVGTKGELGLGEHSTNCGIPTIVLDLRDHGNAVIISISGGMSHSVLVTDTGEAFGWGTSRKGELGHGLASEKVVWTPRKLEIGFPVLGAVAGRNLTFFWGDDGKQALLGNAKMISSTSEGGRALNLSSRCHVFAGWSSLYALDLDGGLDAVGGGGGGGGGSSSRGQVPTADLPSLRHFAAGSEHAIGVTADGKVVAFGWGEHGNCGEPIDSRGNVSGRHNTIPLTLGPGEAISGVGAGCATSFVKVSSRKASG